MSHLHISDILHKCCCVLSKMFIQCVIYNFLFFLPGVPICANPPHLLPLQALRKTGLLTSDPRLRDCVRQMRKSARDSTGPVMMDKTLFRRCEKLCLFVETLLCKPFFKCNFNFYLLVKSKQDTLCMKGHKIHYKILSLLHNRCIFSNIFPPTQKLHIHISLRCECDENVIFLDYVRKKHLGKRKKVCKVRGSLRLMVFCSYRKK